MTNQPTCPVCAGEGRNPRAVSIGEWDSAITCDACETCGGAGLIYSTELYECQGMGCGVIVHGSALARLSERKAPCNCGGPVSQFIHLRKCEWPTDDEWADAVWTLEDFNLEAETMSAAKEHDRLDAEINQWEKYWEPIPVEVPTETPGVFRSYRAAFAAIARLFGAIVGVTLIVTAFVMAVIHQPMEAVLAGAGCLMFAVVFYRLGRKEKDTFWRIIGVAAAGWLTVMAALAWGFVQ